MKRLPAAQREDREIRARAGRAIVQLLFTRPEGLSVERLRQLLREGFVGCTNPLDRAVASLEVFQVVEGMVEMNDTLRAAGLQIEVVNGFARLATTKVQPEAFVALVAPEGDESAPPAGGEVISQGALEVLSAIAMRQPVSLGELAVWFDADKRGQIERLLTLGLVEKLKQPVGRVVYGTTGEFLRRFGLKNIGDLTASALPSNATRLRCEVSPWLHSPLTQ